MKILDKYILKELIKIFLLSIIILTFILFLDKIMYLTELIINKRVSIIEVLKLLIYVSPSFLVLTIPMSVLISSLITFNRMSVDSEITAMKACGMSLYRMLYPVILLSLYSYILCNIIIIYLLPWGNTSFKHLIFNILRTKAKIEIKERVFFTDFDGLVIYITERPVDDIVLKGIFISDTRDKEYDQTIYAREGIIISDNKKMRIGMSLQDGMIHRESKIKDEFQFITFSLYNLYLDINHSIDNKEKILKGNRDMSIGEIMDKIARLKKEGNTYYPELVELNKKFSIPFTCLILGLIGAPLGIKSSRAGKSGGFAIGLAIILLYYVMLIGGESIGDSGRVHPTITIWMPNIILCIIAGYLIKKVGKEIPFTSFSILFNSIQELIIRFKRR